MAYYYGFDKATGNCQFRSSGPVQDMEGIVVMACDELHEIDAIKALPTIEGGFILQLVYKTNAMLVDDLRRKQQFLYDAATNRLSILCEVIRRSTVPEAVERAKNEENAWRDYCVKLFELRFSDPHSVVWPEQPTAQ